jgi:hypothetical protein
MHRSLQLVRSVGSAGSIGHHSPLPLANAHHYAASLSSCHTLPLSSLVSQPILSARPASTTAATIPAVRPVVTSLPSSKGLPNPPQTPHEPRVTI